MTPANPQRSRAGVSTKAAVNRTHPNAGAPSDGQEQPARGGGHKAQACLQVQDLIPDALRLEVGREASVPAPKIFREN